ncbi:MAG: hypothetical protein AB7G44_12690 [Bacteroidia bacterium]
MKKEKLTCLLSIPKNYNPDKLVQALEKQDINIVIHNGENFDELYTADFVVVLLKPRSLMGYAVTGLSARENKKILVIQNADYSKHDFLDRKGSVRCIIPLRKTEEIEKEILKFIKNKRIKRLKTV